MSAVSNRQRNLQRFWQHMAANSLRPCCYPVCYPFAGGGWGGAGDAERPSSRHGPVMTKQKTSVPAYQDFPYAPNARQIRAKICSEPKIHCAFSWRISPQATAARVLNQRFKPAQPRLKGNTSNPVEGGKAAHDFLCLQAHGAFCLMRCVRIQALGGASPTFPAQCKRTIVYGDRKRKRFLEWPDSLG